jgi:hypothetical protein
VHAEHNELQVLHVFVVELPYVPEGQSVVHTPFVRYKPATQLVHEDAEPLHVPQVELQGRHELDVVSS